MAAPDLTPYLRQSQATRQDYAAKMAANTFSRGLAQKRGSRQIGEFQTQFKRQLPGATASFGRRGLAGGGIQSGVQRAAMRNMLGDYTRNLGFMQQDMADDLNQYDLNAAQFQAARDAALRDIEAQKAALIANTAQQLSALRPYMSW